METSFENINWEAFHFLRIEYLWAGTIVLLIIFIGFLFYKSSDAWKKNISKQLQPYVIQKGTNWKPRLIRISIVLMFTLGFLSFLGPTWHQVKTPTKQVESKLIIALDLSQSMLVKDISPNRLERAKFKIQDLLKANPRAETCLLVFAGSSHVAIPFTTDYKIILDQLDGLQPKMMPIVGTEFNALFNKIGKLLGNNKAQAKILLLTDDLEDISLEQVSIFLGQRNVQLYLYPFATPTGGVIPSFKKNSAIDEAKLQSFAEMDRVNILQMTLDASDVNDLAKAISDDLVFEDETEKQEENWQDDGYWLVIPLAFIFLLSFRRGWTINGLILLVGLSSCSGDNKLNKANFEFKDLWYTKEYQAQQAYDAEKYYTAAAEFNDPMRKGVAYFKAGDFVSARTAFEQDTSVNALYNLGLTYAQMGELQQAQAIFEKVLERDPNNKNASQNVEQIIVAREELGNQELNNEMVQEKDLAKNERNDSPEDLSGGGQEATKKDMEKSRKEETAETDQRKAKEMEELPDDFKPGQGAMPKNILMRKVDDDPALFLTKKFHYQVKKGIVEVNKTSNKW
ncbi:vWA domain-containing protein [Labilibacter marinus]|uniref:vWA domain-containing protein n=1 Tax=Labilibacter marinus TaxID=1477105 RepID=UPI00094FDEE3|nr:VWA domain-containing protein [Labilibacter marinus]